MFNAVDNVTVLILKEEDEDLVDDDAAILLLLIFFPVPELKELLLSLVMTSCEIKRLLPLLKAEHGIVTKRCSAEGNLAN